MLKSVRGSLYLIGVLLLAASLIFIAQAHRQQTKLADHAVQAFVAKDVVADILPPPMYLIELRLVLSQTVEGSMPVDEAVKTYQRLTTEYNARVAHWQKNPPFGLEKKLLGKQHEAAQVFIAAAKTELLDKLVAGDKDGARANLEKMHALYQAHRTGVNDTVVAGNAFAEVSVGGFETSTEHSTYTLLGFSLVVFSGLFFLISRNVRDILKPITDAYTFARSITSGDLTCRMTICNKAEIAHLQKALVEMQSSLNIMVSEVRNSTHSISHSSAEIADGNRDLSQRTEQTTTNLQQAASAMEVLTGTVRQSADSARQANQLASSAAEVATRGGQVVAQVVSTMEEINASSKKISDIIGVIDGIAFQTNILALNAAVEAARAGEQGRGFAVVASEVRSLAGRSAEAAKEIKGLIGSSVDKVEVGSRLVVNAGQTMQEIVGSVQRVSDIIGEISAAAAEQSDGIGQVNTSVAQLEEMTQRNTSLVEQGAAAADSLKDQSRRLTQVVSQFKLDKADEATSAPTARRAPKAVASKPFTASPGPATASTPTAKARPAVGSAPSTSTPPQASSDSGATKSAVTNTEEWESF